MKIWTTLEISQSPHADKTPAVRHPAFSFVCCFLVGLFFVWTTVLCHWDFSHRSSCRLTFPWWGICGLSQRHKQTKLAHSILFCSCAYFCLYGLFNCIPFQKFVPQLSTLSLCTSSLNPALLVLSTKYLFMNVSLSPDVILSGWLCLKHPLTSLTSMGNSGCFPYQNLWVYHIRIFRVANGVQQWKNMFTGGCVTQIQAIPID